MHVLWDGITDCLKNLHTSAYFNQVTAGTIYSWKRLPGFRRKTVCNFQRQHSQVTQPPCLSFFICKTGLPSSSGGSRMVGDTVMSVTGPKEVLSSPHGGWGKLIQPKASLPLPKWGLSIVTHWAAKRTSNIYGSFTTKCEIIFSGLEKFWDETQRQFWSEERKDWEAMRK